MPKVKMTKEGALVFTASEAMLRSAKKRLNQKQQVLADKALNKALRDIRAHFKAKDAGWDLNLDLYKDEIYSALLGKELCDYIFLRLCSSKLHHTTGKQSTQLVLRKNK